MAEQRYQAVLAVISDGLSISQVASKVGVSRQTLHSWLARYEAEGLDGLTDRSHRPARCPHQMSASVEAVVVTRDVARHQARAARLAHEIIANHDDITVTAHSVTARVPYAAVPARVQRLIDRRAAKVSRRLATCQSWRADAPAAVITAEAEIPHPITTSSSEPVWCARARSREPTVVALSLRCADQVGHG